MNRAETLQQLAWLCRNGRSSVQPQVEPSGWAQLDAILPGGGWQSGTIVELMPAAAGIGELRLVMPALARLTRQERHVALIAPPYVPFAPALAQYGVRLDCLLIIHASAPDDILWACEQVLRCKSFAAVLAWPATIRDRETRRLQLAAEAGRTTGFVYRPIAAARESSPAALRMKLRKNRDELTIEIIKCRGGRGNVSVRLTADSGWRIAGSKEKPGVSSYPLSAIR